MKNNFTMIHAKTYKNARSKSNGDFQIVISLTGICFKCIPKAVVLDTSIVRNSSGSSLCTFSHNRLLSLDIIVIPTNICFPKFHSSLKFMRC